MGIACVSETQLIFQNQVRISIMFVALNIHYIKGFISMVPLSERHLVKA